MNQNYLTAAITVVIILFAIWVIRKLVIALQAAEDAEYEEEHAHPFPDNKRTIQITEDDDLDNKIRTSLKKQAIEPAEPSGNTIYMDKALRHYKTTRGNYVEIIEHRGDKAIVLEPFTGNKYRHTTAKLRELDYHETHSLAIKLRAFATNSVKEGGSNE